MAGGYSLARMLSFHILPFLNVSSNQLIVGRLTQCLKILRLTNTWLANIKRYSLIMSNVYVCISPTMKATCRPRKERITPVINFLSSKTLLSQQTDSGVFGIVFTSGFLLLPMETLLFPCICAHLKKRCFFLTKRERIAQRRSGSCLVSLSLRVF